MFVSASIYDNYLLSPRPEEYADFFRVFGDKMKVVSGGFTFKAYDEISRLVVKGESTTAKVPTATRFYPNQSQAMFAKGQTLHIDSLNPVSCIGGISIPNRYEYAFDIRMTKVNHIPQLLTRLKGDYIVTSFYGDYNFKSQLFEGFVVLAKSSDILKL